MKLPFCTVLALGLSVGGSLFAAEEKPAAPFKDQRDKIAYSLGVNVGNSLKLQGADVDVEQVINGLRDANAGKAKVTEQEMRETLMAYQQELRAKRAEKFKAESEKSKVEAEATRKAEAGWLAANAQKPNVKSMPDGLQYKVLVAGKGAQPKPSDTFIAHYRGTLINGTEFDSSYTTGRPLTLGVMNVIPGWQEALTNMHVGDKWEIYIPNQLAYGDQAKPKIPAGSALIFEMELLGLEAPKPAAPSFPSLNGTPGGPGAAPQIRVQPAPGAAPGAPQIKVQPAK